MKHLLTLSVQFKLKDSAWISDRDNYKVLNAVTEEAGIADVEELAVVAEGAHLAGWIRSTRERSRSTDYLSIEGAIGLTPFRCTLGQAASRCVSFE